MNSKRMRRCDSEEGSTLLLTIFYGFLALVLVLVVVAATSLYLERKRLLTLADGAALAGAEAFPLESVAPASGTGVLKPALSPAEVDAAVRDYLESAPNAGFEGLTVVRATSVDGQSATVSLSAYWRPPVLTLVLPAGVPLGVTAVARSVFW
ncbi:pilus assembly protein TadG-related protein [Glaciibacter sp. 2TAF33]|uniref:pilus assembly protein TadG-related protein n=1 Tax=Glaciibacter sp. 2TAF33 TaxID=3233015 RepID=UPI003F939CA1